MMARQISFTLDTINIALSYASKQYHRLNSPSKSITRRFLITFALLLAIFVEYLSPRLRQPILRDYALRISWHRILVIPRGWTDYKSHTACCCLSTTDTVYAGIGNVLKLATKCFVGLSSKSYKLWNQDRLRPAQHLRPPWILPHT